MSFYNSIAVRQIGRSHVKNDLPCQDACKTFTLNDVTVAAVSDGCGSAQHSEYGSELIVDILSQKFALEFDRLYEADVDRLKSEINAFVLHQAALLAEQHGWDVRDIKATYLVVAVKGSRWLTCRLGDGAIVLLHKDKSHELNVEEKTGAVEFTTYFTTSDALQHISLQRYDDDTIVGGALMTDGVMDCLIDSTGKLNQMIFWAFNTNKNNRRGEVAEKIQMLVNDIANHDGENPIDDDCTLAVISAAGVEQSDFVKKFINQVSVLYLKKATELISNIDDNTLEYIHQSKYILDGIDSKKLILYAADIASRFSGRETVNYFMDKYSLKGKYFNAVVNICVKAKLLCIDKDIITFV